MTEPGTVLPEKQAIVVSEVPPCFYVCSWVWQLSGNHWWLKHPSRLCPDHGYLAEEAITAGKRGAQK